MHDEINVDSGIFLKQPKHVHAKKSTFDAKKLK